MELGPRVFRGDDVLVGSVVIGEASPGGEGKPTSYICIRSNTSFSSCEISEKSQFVFKLFVICFHYPQLSVDELLQ